MDPRFILMEIRLLSMKTVCLLASAFSLQILKLAPGFHHFHLCVRKHYVFTLGELNALLLSSISLEKFTHFSYIFILFQTDMQFPYNFDDIREGDKVAVICDDKSRVHIIVNNEDKGFVDYEVSSSKYAMFDLYGRCEQVSVVPCNNIPLLKTGEDVELERENEKIVKEERIATSEKSEGITLAVFISQKFFIFFFEFINFNQQL